MKTSRFSDSQIIAVLKQAEAGSPVRSVKISAVNQLRAHRAVLWLESRVAQADLH